MTCLFYSIFSKVSDDYEVRKILTASHNVTETVGLLSCVDNMPDLLAKFKVRKLLYYYYLLYQNLHSTLSKKNQPLGALHR
jgi:hypothetical protein